MSFIFKNHDWINLHLSTSLVSINSIACPWAWNIYRHGNYDRLFWSIYDKSINTPLLVRPFNYPFIGDVHIGCDHLGNRLDCTPSPTHSKPPSYELILGNMRYCALYIQRYDHVPILMLPTEEHLTPVTELWDKYHAVMEGNWYDDPDNQIPSKYHQGF